MSKSIEDLAAEAIDTFVANSVGKKAAKKESEKVVPKGPEFEEVKETKSRKPKGTKMYSELFGWDKSVLGNKTDMDFPVRVYTKKDWDEEDLYYIPDLADFEDRVIDHEVMYPFVRSLQAKKDIPYKKVMVVGPTGSGKTTMAEYYCAVIGQPFFRINGRQDMESDSIIGRPWVDDGTMKFHKGEIPKAMEKGWFVLFDEPFKVPSGILMTLQRMMERGGVLQIDDMPGELADKQIVPNEKHRICFADNVIGTGDNVDKYGATLIQDSSLLNRIDIVLKVPYLSETVEVELVRKKFPRIPHNRAEHMVRLLNLLRDGFDKSELSSPASLRNIEAWGEMAVDVESYAKAFKWTLLNRYADEAEQAAVRDLYYTVFEEHL